MALPDDRTVATALAMAKAAAEVATRYFRRPIPVDDKADKSPVTVADREIEQTLRKILAAERPADGVIGEEYGADRPDAAALWVIDPIDGTKGFITGSLGFGTLIGLLVEGVPVLGVISQPVTGEVWLGAAGRPTTLNGRPVATRTGRCLADAYLFASSPSMFARGEEADSFARLSDAAKYTRFGQDCYAYGLLSSGFTDLVCEADLKLHDYTALVPVVAGAGGVITAWDGSPLSFVFGRPPARVIAAGSAELHAEAVERLSPIRP